VTLLLLVIRLCFSFSFPQTAPLALCSLSLHDAFRSLVPPGRNLSWNPACAVASRFLPPCPPCWPCWRWAATCWPVALATSTATRSEEHTSELQSRENLVCRLLLEKKKTIHSLNAKSC